MPSDNSVIYEVKITETAWEQMIEHAKFLANVSVDAAGRLVDEFVEKSNSLARMPDRCPWLVHRVLPLKRYRKMLFGKYYMALFETIGNTVYVASVFDCRQDYNWLLYRFKQGQNLKEGLG